MAIQRFPLRKEEHPDHFLYDFEGLMIKTDRWDRKENDRVLVLGRGVGVHVLMNYMQNHPELVRGKDIFEPFAGSGPMGLLSLKLGAKHADLLDINPRAIQFMKENVARNRFDESQYSIHEEDISQYHPSQKCDILFANPPFIPVPDDVGMPIHSDGGTDGNRLTNILLSKVDDFLKPQGEAFLVVFQVEDQHGPLLLYGIRQYVTKRHVELTRMQSESFNFNDMVSEYIANVPKKRQEILTWSELMKKQYGEHLTINYYVIHVGKERNAPAGYTIREYERESDVEKYGKGFHNVDYSSKDHFIEIRVFVEKEES